MCSHLNRVNEAILMSTHNIPFQYKKENYTKVFQISAVKGFS